jgi:hypothetical protein
MNKIGVKGPQFMNPRWFNTVVHRNFKTVVANGAVVVEGVTLTLEEALPDGSAIRVYFTSSFYAVRESEIEAEEIRQKSLRDAEVERRRQLWNDRRAEAEKFNATVNLPVPWHITQKEVLSGLSATSSGDGCYKNTVQHVELLADFTAGRIRRRKHDLLCTSASGDNGQNWSNGNRNIFYKDGDSNDYMPKPTCKKCLNLLERFRTV